MSLLKEVTAVPMTQRKLEPIGSDARGTFEWGKFWRLPISKASLQWVATPLFAVRLCAVYSVNSLGISTNVLNM